MARARPLEPGVIPTSRDWDRPAIKSELVRLRITHVVTTADREILSDALELLYADERESLPALSLADLSWRASVGRVEKRKGASWIV